MSQRNRMETKARHRHGGMWHDSDEARKAHLKESKYRKRARRRLDKAIVEEAKMGEPQTPSDGFKGPVRNCTDPEAYYDDVVEHEGAVRTLGEDGRVHIHCPSCNDSWTERHAEV